MRFSAVRGVGVWFKLWYNSSMQSASLAPLRKTLFWDADIEKLDAEQDAQFVIGRVLDFGNLAEWKHIQGLYGRKRIADAARRHVFSEPRSASFWARVLSLPVSEVKCTRKPSLKTPSAFLRR